jgi:hypothetical protein
MKFWPRHSVKPNPTERATRDGAAVSHQVEPPLAAPLATPAADSFAAIRELASGHQGLLDIMREFHGETEGTRLYEAAVQSRETAARRATLEAELDAFRSEIGAEISEAERLSEDLQRDADYAEGARAAALGQLYAQRIRVEQLKNKRSAVIAEIREEMYRPPGAGPPPAVKTPTLLAGIQQWSVPDWYRPEAEDTGLKTSRRPETGSDR